MTFVDQRWCGFACALFLPVLASAGMKPDAGIVSRIQVPHAPVFLTAAEEGEQARERTDLVRQLVTLQRSGGDWARQARDAGIAVDGVRLLLEVRLQPGQSRQSAERLARGLGLAIHAHPVPTLMNAWVPVTALAALTTRAEVAQVRPARRVQPLEGGRLLQPLPKAGGVVSEGLSASGVAPYHALGADGTGTVVALIDGGFDGWMTRQGTGDWPSGAQIRRFVVDGSTVYECPGPSQCSNFDAPANGDHGTNTVEIAYDMAPGATFWIYQTTYVLDWYQALKHASDSANHSGLRADVISASLGAPLDGIGDGSACPPTWSLPCGTIAEASELARSRGSLVVNAAGNERKDHWGGLYNGSGTAFGSYVDTHLWPSGGNLNPSPYCHAIGSSIRVTAHWDDWATWPTSDYDIRLYRQDTSSWTNVASSTDYQDGTSGQTPQESLQYTVPSSGSSVWCPSGGRAFALMVLRWEAPTNRNLQIFTNMGLNDFIAARSLNFPSDSPAVFAVGALDATGSFDTSSWFSSEGPVLAPGGGLGATSIPKPDGGNFSWVSTQTDGTTAFGGTSAATPHVAGIAAVLAQMRLEKDIQTASNPAEALHKGLARVGLDGDNDLGTAGHDTQHGYGRMRLRECSESVSIAANAWHMVGLPCDARAGNTLPATFGSLGLGTYGTHWGVWTWNPATSTYQMLAANAALDLGRGYWIYSLNPGSGTFSGLVPDLTEAWAMTTTGASGLGRPHLLSNPRRFTLDWDELRYYYDGAEHDFATAYADGKVRSTMWRWNPGSSDYDVFNGLSGEGQIAAGGAFWLRTLADVEVRFPTTPTQTSLSRPAATDGGKNRGVAWSLDVSLDAPDGSTSAVRFGHDTIASDRFDGLDVERLGAPTARPYLMVLPRPELGAYAADYVRDFRFPKAVDEWRMEIRSQGQGTAVLNFDGPAEVLATATLMDVATGKNYRLSTLGGRHELLLEPGVRELRWVFKRAGGELSR